MGNDTQKLTVGDLPKPLQRSVMWAEPAYNESTPISDIEVTDPDRRNFYVRKDPKIMGGDNPRDSIRMIIMPPEETVYLDYRVEMDNGKLYMCGWCMRYSKLICSEVTVDTGGGK